MINYYYSCFNTTTLFRVYGSAAYKALGYALISTAIYLVFYYTGNHLDGNPYGIAGLKQYELLDHPYPVSVLIGALTVVLSAKVTFSYNRFWEACTALHNMHSKWLDVALTMAAFHMQSKSFEKTCPPSFGDHPNLNDNLVLHRDREQATEFAVKATFSTEDFSSEESTPTKTPNTFKKQEGGKQSKTKATISIHAAPPPRGLYPILEYKARKDRHNASSANGTSNTTVKSSSNKMSMGMAKNPVPTLFLQELAHLTSLLSAVALSTLRCSNSSDAIAPLVEFEPGQHWPHYNSDNDPDMQKYGYKPDRFGRTVKYLFDISRTKSERDKYNAARPFPVIGGISDREAYLLQSARGGAAKCSLVFLWLQEFLIREHVHGSIAPVAPPIFSRIPQYLSDGHLWYNAARKMAYIPFPFPHTQMATLFVAVIVIVMPTLMLSKTAVWFGLFLNFLCVMLFAGLNELSKELEYPFRGMPNDLPLNLFQAHFNEALLTIFGGYHPDSWWEIKGDA